MLIANYVMTYVAFDAFAKYLHTLRIDVEADIKNTEDQHDIGSFEDQFDIVMNCLNSIEQELI